MLGVAAIALFLSTVVRVTAGRGARHDGVLVASTLLLTLDAATSLQPYLPTRYWLSFVDLFRDPILWRNVTRGTGAPARVRRGAARRRLGQLHDEGHQGLTRAASAGADGGVRDRGCRAPSSSIVIRITAGSLGRSPWEICASGQTDCTAKSSAPVDRGGVGRYDGLVVGRPDRHPARALGRLVARVEAAEQVAVGTELLAPDRAGVRA